MNKLILLLSIPMVAQVALTKEERLEMENSTLRLQLIKVQEEREVEKWRAVFQAACKRADIPQDKCKLDQVKGELVKQEDQEKK